MRIVLRNLVPPIELIIEMAGSLSTKNGTGSSSMRFIRRSVVVRAVVVRIASAMAMYSASAVLRATKRCHLENHEIGVSLKVITAPDVELLAATLVPKYASE